MSHMYIEKCSCSSETNTHRFWCAMIAQMYGNVGFWIMSRAWFKYHGPSAGAIVWNRK